MPNTRGHSLHSRENALHAGKREAHASRNPIIKFTSVPNENHTLKLTPVKKDTYKMTKKFFRLHHQTHSLPKCTVMSCLPLRNRRKDVCHYEFPTTSSSCDVITLLQAAGDGRGVRCSCAFSLFLCFKMNIFKQLKHQSYSNS